MAKNVLQSTILSGAGAVAIAPGAQIEVRSPSGLLVPLWLDRDGTQPTTNPTTADSDGFFRVYLNSGRYHITARSGGESREWRDVLLGSAAGYDVDDMLAALAAGVYTSVADGLANTAEGDFFWVAHETGEDVLTLYRVVDGDAELWAALPRGEVVRELTDRAETAAEAAEEDAQAAQDALDAILALGDLPSAVAAAEAAAQSAQQDAQQTALDRTQTGQDAQTAQQAAQDAAEEADRAEAAADELELAKVPMFFVAWCPDRNHIWPGYVAADGQQLSSETYPDASAGITAGAVPTTDDATWLADPTQRGKYVADDGSGYFRVPDYNGRYSGSLGATFQRGDGVKSAGEPGVIQRDAFQGHTFGDADGRSMKIDVVGSGTDRSAMRTAEGTPLTIISDGVNGAPRIADETRPLNVTGCWVIKLFGAVVNPGSADAAQLASDYANLNGAFQALDSQLGDAIVYPAGGDASSPGVVETKSIYVSPNPFPGHRVSCELQLFIGGEWHVSTVNAGNNSYGALAGQVGEEIWTVTANTGVAHHNPSTGLFTTTASIAGSNLTSAPARVVVRKLKGAI